MTNYFINGPHEVNIYSQYGEDGIIKRIISDFSFDIQTTCEFGAWDGKHFSNTFALSQVARKLVMIEGDPNKFKDLLNTKKEYPSIHPVNIFVEPIGINSLDMILNREKISNVDILSIDIDGYDLLILRNLTLRPKLIVIEFNPTFGIIKEYESVIGENSGNSFYSIFKLMKEKSYSLVAYTKTNLFFVESRLIREKGYNDINLDVFDLLRDVDSSIFQVSSAYDGRAIAFGKYTNPWDGCRLAKVYKHPEWAYGWEPTRLQVAYRALRTLSLTEIFSGIKKANQRGWFKF